MNTLHFKYAVEVAKTGSISQAAENLFMAQPNLSKAIREMEDTLGIAIFERTSKGVIPTKQGTAFLGYARRILVQLEKMESIYISQKEREELQSLKISIPRGSYISAGFAKFAAELDMQKGIDIVLQETNSLQSIINVAENGYNLGIIRYQTLYENYFLDYLKEKELEYELIWEFQCLVLMSREHSMADCETIGFKSLKNSSIELIHGDNVVPYLPAHEIKQVITEEADNSPKKIFVYERGSQMDLLTQVPQSFMWVSPLPQKLLERYNFVQRRCKIDNNSFKDVLIYPRGYKFMAVERLFLNKLSEIKNEVAFCEYK